MPETQTITVTDVAFGGDGVGRLPDGRVLFVPFTAPGDEVTVELTSVHRKHARGRVTTLPRPGPERVTPTCPLFGRCGGCQYQHLAYSLQVQLKAQQLLSVLRRLGGLQELPPLAKIVPSPAAYGYRNKLRLEAGAARGYARPPETQPCTAGGTPAGGENCGRQAGRLPYHEGVYGFYALDNRTVLPVTNCPLAMSALNARLPQALAAGPTAPGASAALSLTLRVPASGDPIFFYGRAAADAPCLTESLLGHEVQVPAGGFWQVNPPVAEHLLGTAREWLTPQPTALLVDAYAGVGAFSLALGARPHRVVLVELDPAATATAARNRDAWRLPAAETLAQRAESALPGLLERAAASERRQATVILDPPRTGCEPPALDALAAHPVACVLYVSCNAATFARDLRRLCTDGPYRLQRLALFDMFPQTAHFETAGLLVSGAGES